MAAPAPTWEYHVEVLTITGQNPQQARAFVQGQWRDRLNALGAEGWELIAQDAAQGQGVGTSGWAWYEGTFKRPATAP